MHGRLMAGVALAAVSTGVSAAGNVGCDALGRAGLFPDTTVTAAKLVPADAAKKLPSYCEVVAVISPVPDSRIGVVYRLPDTWNGKVLGLGGGGWAAYPLTRGGEAGWARFIAASAPPGGSSLTGVEGLRSMMLGKADFDLDAFDADRDFRTARDSKLAKLYEAADPDISAFVKRGGKLLLWHGWDDAGPSPFATIDYFESVQKITGPKVKSLDASARFFLAPGVYHCSGGPGPDQFDLLGTLDTWVEKGTAPATLLATRADSPLSRPLCPYPALPRYQGRGNPDDAASFNCR